MPEDWLPAIRALTISMASNEPWFYPTTEAQAQGCWQLSTRGMVEKSAAAPRGHRESARAVLREAPPGLASTWRYRLAPWFYAVIHHLVEELPRDDEEAAILRAVRAMRSGPHQEADVPCPSGLVVTLWRSGPKTTADGE